MQNSAVLLEMQITQQNEVNAGENISYVIFPFVISRKNMILKQLVETKKNIFTSWG